MTSRDFAYWLQGFFEISDQSNSINSAALNLTTDQINCIKKHLALVFKHEIDPGMGSINHQQELTDIHHPPDFYKPHGPHHDPVTEEQKKLLQNIVDKIPSSPGHFPGSGIKINC